MSTTTINNVNDAIVLFTAGKVDKGSVLSWAKAANLVTMDVLLLVSKGAVDAAEAGDLLPKPKAASKASLSCKISLRGAISVYGNGQWPDTKYAEQWERLLSFAKAEKDNPIAKLIAENKAEEYVVADVVAKDKSGKDKEYLAEVAAGKHPHAKIVGDKLFVQISRKPAK